jgi:hypothetical protein
VTGEFETPPALDASAGRTASRPELRRRLSTAPPAFLDGALGNPSLGLEELLLLLRNRRAPSAVLSRVGQNPVWLRKREVCRLLAQHPLLPLGVARDLLVRLGWKDLLEVAVSPRAHAFVRRQAERLLQVRMEELTAGERVSLARRAPRAVLGSLIHSDDSRVLCSMLGNPALGEPEAVRVAGTRRAGSEVLVALAGHPRWGVRQSVRSALLCNARTPVPVALRLVAELSSRELRRLIADPAVPKIVRVGAERRLAVRGAK